MHTMHTTPTPRPSVRRRRRALLVAPALASVGDRSHLEAKVAQVEFRYITDGSAAVNAMAAGDLGYLVLLQGPTSEAEPWPALRFARLDGHGRMLSSSPQLLEPRLNGLSEVLPFEVAWADDGFGALYGNSPGGMPLHVALFFEFLRRASP